ncbi:MAG: hypothetical protein IPO41_10955 [Acidobacteria bacterium]|nr:hypothetical protein [Acidobacteriota bacterium]MBP7474152.1 hypothetical protein [Pyrinomonadaceae bacterium]MBP9109052.1 hypothetical protein [Pyrinomonadaceae bacterium]
MRSTKSYLVTIILSVASILLLTGLSTAQSSPSAAAAKEFKRLVNLQTALGKIPMTKQDKEPHRSFLKRNDNDIVYSDPAGEWYVRSKRFWDLAAKYRNLPIADKIAWAAAENQLPGECEGYVPCYLSVMRMTYGEYLTRFPKGAYRKRAIQEMTHSFTRIADDAASTKRNYDAPTESGDQAEFLKAVRELRDILLKVPKPEAAKALSSLKRVEDSYK